MGSVIIKPEQERDFYIIWSSITDGPTAFGTKKSLQDANPADQWTDDHFARADEFSSSSRLFPESWDKDFSMVFENSGYIRRSQMIELCRILNDIWEDEGSWYKDPRVIALLEPFEDD